MRVFQFSPALNEAIAEAVEALVERQSLIDKLRKIEPNAPELLSSGDDE